MKLSRGGLAAFFTFTGVMHFLRPRFFEAIVPPAIEARKHEVVAISGAAEIAGAALALHPASRRLGRWWLLALLVAVFPANIHMAVNRHAEVPWLGAVGPAAAATAGNALGLAVDAALTARPFLCCQ